MYVYVTVINRATTATPIIAKRKDLLVAVLFLMLHPIRVLTVVLKLSIKTNT